ncbi:MAG: two-component system, response regulator PdtaR [Chloroflexota bacterium]|nr:two-component system, response regulator PdtaR [Chloroflexota bacterium]
MRDERENLRVLVANERDDQLRLLVPSVVALGHEVVAQTVEVAEVAGITASEQPDVALVGLGASSGHALRMIDGIVRQAACPVILLLHAPDPEFVNEASKRGVFAVITDRAREEWQDTLSVVLRRFAEYHDLRGAFGRRSTIERAKGILMERHSVGEQRAFEMLRAHARTRNRKLIDIASAVVDGHALLPKRHEPSAEAQVARDTPAPGR